MIEPHEVSEVMGEDCPKYGKIEWTKIVNGSESPLKAIGSRVNVHGDSDGNIYVRATCKLPGGVKFYSSLTLAVISG